MDAQRSRPDQFLARCAAILGVFVACIAAGSTLGAQAITPRTPSTPRLIDGRTLAAIDLPANPQELALSFGAARAWTWREGATERLFLDRDVRVNLGPYHYSARRATIWIEPVRVEGVDAEQVAVFFDEVSDPSGAPWASQSGPRLLVTAIAITPAPTLRADLLRRARPEDPFLEESEARLARYLSSIIESPGRPEGQPPGLRVPGGPGEAPTGPSEAPTTPEVTPPPPATMTLKDPRGPLPPAERSPADVPREGIVYIYAPQIELVSPGRGDARGEEAGAKDESALVVSGGVSIQYSAIDETTKGLRTVELSAERGVVFLTRVPALDVSRFSVEDVAGVYLEGDVSARDARYTLRGNRVFYDLRTEKAIVLDAVFWAYDQEKGLPLYLRADAIRQESQSQWSAKNVRLANVGFAEPHFAIGAKEVTITHVPRTGADSEPDRFVVDAEDPTFRALGAPLLWLPRYRGTVTDRPSPLRRLSIDSEDGDTVVRTAWDIYALAGLDAARGNSATLLADAYFARGPAAGVDLSWRVPAINGSLFAYYIYDNGEDRMPTGDKIQHDDDSRGMVEAEQVWRLSDHWTLFLEGTYISDETFVEAFFRREARTRREFANSAYLRYLDENQGFSIEARGTFNDFVSNEYLLQSLGYMTQRLPEASYYRLNDDLFGGLMRYSSHYRTGLLSLSFTEPTLSQLGFSSVNDAEAGFGQLPTDSIGDVLRAAGVSENSVFRFDTRHELEVPLQAGPLSIVPFMVGRFTAYDDNFDDFNDNDNEDYRFWGAGGLRVATTIQRINDKAKSKFFDIDRVRHIVEPSATLWAAGSTIDQRDLPIYDDWVESIADGTVFRTGVRNTWQTYRGDAGRRYSVDWLVLDTNYVWSANNADRESPLGRFIEFRPEHSNLGEFLSNTVRFQLTEAVALVSDLIYDMDDSTVARVTAGAIIDHGFGFSTFSEVRYLDTPESTLVDLGARYELTRKYAASLTGVFDTKRTEFQGVTARVERRLPQWTIEFGLAVDNVADTVSFAVGLRPVGFGGEDRARVLTRDLLDEATIRPFLPERDRLDYGPFAQER